MVLIRRQDHGCFLPSGNITSSPRTFLSLERWLREAWTHYLAYKPSLGGENNYVAKVIINTGEYCKTTLKLSIDITEVSQCNIPSMKIPQLQCFASEFLFNASCHHNAFMCGISNFKQIQIKMFHTWSVTTFSNKIFNSNNSIVFIIYELKWILQWFKNYFYY